VALVTALARITLLRVISPETRERLRPVSTVPDSTPVSGDLVAKFFRWCGFVAARRSGGEVTSRIADHRVLRLLELARSMLADNAEHVATCCMIEGPTAPLVRPGC